MVVHPSFQQPSLNYCMVTTRALHLTLKSLYKCYQTLQVRNETLQKMVTAVFECDRQHCSISFGEEMLQTFQHQSVFLSWSNAHGHFTRKKAAAGMYLRTWCSLKRGHPVFINHSLWVRVEKKFHPFAMFSVAKPRRFKSRLTCP